MVDHDTEINKWYTCSWSSAHIQKLQDPSTPYGSGGGELEVTDHAIVSVIYHSARFLGYIVGCMRITYK